jgi:hypothetical protein
VSAHTTLAYAVTEYGAQGMTVYSSHSLIGRGAARPDVYVPGTRGTDANTFYVISQSTPDHHDPERLDSTPVAILAAALGNPIDGGTAAELARRLGVEEGASLAWVGGQWDLLTGELGRAEVTATLRELLPADFAAAVVDESGYDRLVAAVRLLELRGHDPRAALGQAITQGTLHDAHSVSDVLRYRLRRLDNDGRVPERAVRDGDWRTYTAHRGGPIGDYVQVLAGAAITRQNELGNRAAADPPGWALAAPALGPVPHDPRQRGEWVRRAGIVAAYRDLHAVPDTHESIGAAPSRERAFHHTLWRHAQAALGHPADTLDYTTATVEQLRGMRDAWRRAQTWAPAYVADELHTARHLAEEYRRDAVIWRAALDQHPDDSPQRALEQRDVDAAERLAAVHSARVAALEQIDAVRTEWHDRHRDTEQRAHFAGDELERRGLDRDTAAPLGEQHELFDLTTRDANGHTTAQDVVPSRADHNAAIRRAAVARGRVPDPAQHELELDDVPRRQTAADVEAADSDATVQPTRAGAGTNTGASRRTDDPIVREGDARVTGQVDRGSDHAAQTVPNGYAALFDEAQDRAEREAVQPGLFEAQPAADAVAAAQPLRAGEPQDLDAAAADQARAAGSARTPSGDDTGNDTAEPGVTVGQAYRDAEIIASLRDRIAARAATEAARLHDDTAGNDRGQGYDVDGFGSEYGMEPDDYDEDYGRASHEVPSAGENTAHTQGMSR